MGEVDKSKAFHSSAIGRVQSGSNFGTASMSNNRTCGGQKRLVQKYSASKLGNGAVPEDLRKERRAYIRPEATKKAGRFGVQKAEIGAEIGASARGSKVNTNARDARMGVDTKNARGVRQDNLKRQDVRQIGSAAEKAQARAVGQSRLNGLRGCLR